MLNTIEGSSLQPYIKLKGTGNYKVWDDVNVSETVECVTSDTVPPSLPEMAENFPNDDINGFLEYFLENPFSDEQVQLLNEVTTGQSSNPLWHAHRKGRITGSKIHSVLTRRRTMLKNPDKEIDLTNLIINVMGYKQVDPSIPALKYGRLQEPVAQQAFAVNYHQHHENPYVMEAGLIVTSGLAAFTGASPDGLIECDCCGYGLLEVKCPLSIAGQVPTAQNLAYLVEDDNGLHLKHTHSYYSQVIFQLHITGREWCDFYIFTGKHDNSFTQRIYQDDKLWTEMKEATTFMFTYFISHELVTGTIKKELSEKADLEKRKSAVERQPTPKVITQSPAIPLPTPPEQPKKKQRTTRKTKKTKSKPVYVCATCTEICKEAEAFDDNKENSVECDQCLKWFHWGCVDFQEVDDDTRWFCDDCLN